MDTLLAGMGLGRAVVGEEGALEVVLLVLRTLKLLPSFGEVDALLSLLALWLVAAVTVSPLNIFPMEVERIV